MIGALTLTKSLLNKHARWCPVRRLLLGARARGNDGSDTPNSLRLCAMLDAWCYAPYCAMRNARGAIFLGSLTSKLADSLCVDYLAPVTTRWSVWRSRLLWLSKRPASNRRLLAMKFTFGDWIWQQKKNSSDMLGFFLFFLIRSYRQRQSSHSHRRWQALLRYWWQSRWCSRGR